MSENQQYSLFTELTDTESATVSGASITSGVSGIGSNSDANKSNPNGLNMLFFVPQPSQLYMYDPNRQRPYKTLAV
ncbi:MAG: secretion protein HlyD [Microcoleus sp. CSU_2_2]|nr:secretion protein HlyD [Microcoleus sp. SU_5_3]NJS12780.1 secretion protein HlyD [Microcoleus sp. CSU_2_2]